MTMSKGACEIRESILQTFKDGNRGHVPSALSLVEILYVLYRDILNIDPANPQWSERDRCILSKGHGCLSIYAVLEKYGFISKDDLKTFCKFGSILGGHPKYGKVPGIEASTGSLGHGLPIGVGQALSLRSRSSAGRVFVIMGDGECDEGSVWEAAMSAYKHRLDNLVAIIDYNHVQSYASTEEVQPLEPFADKWRAFGFGVQEVDGHNEEELSAVFKSLPLTVGRPSAIICHTIKGKGVRSLENNLAWHHKAKVSDDEVRSLIEEMIDA